ERLDLASVFENRNHGMKLRRNLKANMGFGGMLRSSWLFFVNLCALIVALLVLTAFIGWCVVSEMLGASTCKSPPRIPVDNSGLIANQKLKTP
ncbi:MAG: DUF2892 domain-containing protein, partial [Desulfobacterales bacterium]